MKIKLLSFALFAMTATVGISQYCGGGPATPVDSNVEIASLEGETLSIDYEGCPGVEGVEDQLAQVADLKIGELYSVNVIWGACSASSFNYSGMVWIDYDGSDSFEDDEAIGLRTSTFGASIDGYSFSVPDDAIEGDTHMRIVQWQGGPPPPFSACAEFDSGSSIDFTINLSALCEDLTIDVSDYELCEGELLTLDAEGIGAITWTGGAVDEVPFAPGVPGIYSFIPSSDDDGDCPIALEDSVVIEVFALPTVIAAAVDSSICDGEIIALLAEGDADEYVWNDGDDLELMPSPGTYTFILDGSATSGVCAGIEVRDSVEVTVNELPTITASVDDSPICIGLDVVLTGGGGLSYDWDVDGVEDGEPYTPDAIGTTTYTVVGTDENDCTNSASVDVEVVDVISITGSTTDEIAGGDGTISIDIIGGAPTYTFDWDNDELDDFDDDEDLTGLSAGTYAVIIRGAAGCESTEAFTVDSQLGIGELESNNILVYPNPTADNVNIELAGIFQYELITINGDVILKGIASDKETLSLASFADGIYFVQILSKEDSTTLKIVKN